MYVEVKGKMTESDAEKILQFSGIKDFESNEIMHPILIVAGIPDGDCIADIEDFCQDLGYNGFPEIKHRPYPFNFETIDGDYFVAHPGINKEGQFELFGDDRNYTYDRDDTATLRAYKLARQARFEHGETPHFADRRR